MPITTILQHQRDREKLNQPDLGTPTAEEDHNIGNKDTIKEVRLFFWPSAMERYIRISLLTKEEKAAAAARRRAAPDSTYKSKKLDNPKSSCSKVATRSTKKDSSRSRKAKQTNSNHLITSEKTTAQPRATPIDRRSPRTMSTVNCDSRQASCGLQQNNTQPSRKSNEPRQNAPSQHHGGPPSPTDSVYEVARRAVNFLDIHKTQDTEPQDTVPRDTVPRDTAPRSIAPKNTVPQNLAPQNTVPQNTVPRNTVPRNIAPSIIDAQQVINHALGEVRTRERCNAIHTPPASHSSAQTSPVSHKAEKTPPIRWSTIQTYPSCRDAIVFSDKKKEREMISAQQRKSMQRPRPQPYNGPRPKSKSAAARRRAILKHSVTYTLPAANPQTPAAPEQQAVYHPTMTSNQVHPPPPAVVSHSASTLRQATPVHSVMTLRPGPTSYPPLMPRPPTASQMMANTQPPARWQPIYPKSTATSQQVTTVAKETNRERGRRLRREASLLRRDSPPLGDPLETTITKFQPSVGNRVVKHLIKKNPEAVAASKLSHEIPKETAVHYNSILTWQAENAQATGDPSPQGHPTFIEGVEPRAASSDGVPVSREAQTLAVIVVPIRSTPVSEQIVNTENHPSHNHSNTLVPQHGVQPHPYSRVPPGESDNAPNGYGNYSSVSTQQSMYEQRERRAMDNRDSDIQEISRQDWQAANRDSPRYRADQRAQSVVVSAPYERTIASSASASSVNPQSIPEPYFEENEDMLSFGESEEMMLPPSPQSPQSPIRQNPVSISAQAQAQAQTVKKPSNQANPIYGGIHKRKSSRASRTTPPQTTVSRIAISQLVHSSTMPRISISQLVHHSAEAPKTGLPQTAVRRIAISQLVLPSTVPRIAISQLVHSSTVPRISISQLVNPSTVPRVAISQLVHPSTEVPKTVVPRVAISQLVNSPTEVPKPVVPQAIVRQATMPQTSPRTPLPSARPDNHRRVRRSRGGMWLSQDDLDRWQEEIKDPYHLPSFKDSFNDVAMTDCQTSHEKQTSSEPAGGVFSLDAYHINTVASCARNWL
ncbi:hypothetical protein J3E68DRAFT_68446 [Trichoderma sp. SZMC 28012]